MGDFETAMDFINLGLNPTNIQAIGSVWLRGTVPAAAKYRCLEASTVKDHIRVVLAKTGFKRRKELFEKYDCVFRGMEGL